MKYLWFLFVLNITITWDLDKTGVTKGYKIYYTQGGGASPAVNDIIYKLGRIRFEPVY